MSSLVLISFMIVLVGAKDLALGFCLCQEALFLGKGPCPPEEETCCGSEQDEPCEDCVVPVQLEVADYLWTSDDFTDRSMGALEDLSAPDWLTFQGGDIGTERAGSCLPFREPPPLPGRALLARHCRFLL